jgi:hypothetical protein
MFKYCITGTAFLLLTSLVFGAEVGFPIIGSYGFDWLKQQTTRCTQITASEAIKFEHCNYSKEYAFGLDLFAYSCKVDDRSEYILLKTKSQCQETFETMQANAP